MTPMAVNQPEVRQWLSELCQDCG